MSDEEVYRPTPLGILTTVLPEREARIAWDALELHIRRFYGPVGGTVVDGGKATFTKLERSHEV